MASHLLFTANYYYYLKLFTIGKVNKEGWTTVTDRVAYIKTKEKLANTGWMVELDQQKALTVQV